VIVNAFSMSSSYEPIPYVLPPGVNFDPRSSFSNPGEILPNLHFTDLLDIYGAVYRAPTIIAGLHVYCIVFESFLLEYIPVDVFDLAGLCGDLERGDTSALENDCLEYTVPNIYGSNYPISLRPI
uniref:hypothetical protein n=1 Tax=Salmonella sp. s55004 TaxID=3159675 RepID=UPI003981769F